MVILDRVFKNLIVDSGLTEYAGTLDSWADANQARLKYLLWLFTDVWPNASRFFPNPNSDGPTISPSSTTSVLGKRFGISFPGPHPLYPDLKIRFEIGHVGLDATPDVTSSSDVWDFSFGVSFSESNVPVFVKAQYFNGTTPVSAQTVAVYRMPMEIALFAAGRAGLAASNSYFFKDVGVILTAWLSPAFQGDEIENNIFSNSAELIEKRKHFIDALRERLQNGTDLLRYMAHGDEFAYKQLPPVPAVLPAPRVVYFTPTLIDTTFLYDLEESTASGVRIEFITKPNLSLSLEYRVPFIFGLKRYTPYPGNPINTGPTGYCIVTIVHHGADLTDFWNADPQFVRAFFNDAPNDSP